MDLEFKNANDLGENPALKETVATDTELKEWLVNYVGDKRNPENSEVTVEMIIETIGEEFPEFLLVVAEENWIRGYHQALVDVDTGQKLMEAEESDEQQSS